MLDTIKEKPQSQIGGGCFLSHGVLTFQGCYMKTSDIKFYSQRESHRCSSELVGFTMTNQTMSINMKDILFRGNGYICWVRRYNMLKKAFSGWKKGREPRGTFWTKGVDNWNKLCIKSLNTTRKNRVK